MPTDDDPVFEALASLPPITPDAEWESRVRARCHSAILKRRTVRQAGRNLSNAVLAAVSGAAALCVYLVLALAEAVRLARHL